MSLHVTILGSGSALPVAGRHPSSQWVNVESTSYLVDCGEGTQFRLRELKLSASKLRAICISHLHGDHCYGLFGLLDSMSLTARRDPLYLVAPKALHNVLIEIGRATRKVPSFPIHFIATDPSKTGQKVYADEHVSIESFPLQHGIDCTGFSFRTQPAQRNVRKEKLFDGFPIEAIRRLKAGEDVHNPDGTVLFSVADYTTAPPAPKRYAYCSDTVYFPQLTDYLHGVDLLYHEATFAEELADKAHLRGHSTSGQAAAIARDSAAGKLLIGHFSSRYADTSQLVAEAREVFPNTQYAEEGATFTA